MPLLPALINVLAVLIVVLNGLLESPIVPPDALDEIVFALAVANAALAYLRGRVPQLKALIG